MSKNDTPKVQRYYVSRFGKVSSAMFNADVHFIGDVKLYDDIDEAAAALAANPPLPLAQQIKW